MALEAETMKQHHGQEIKHMEEEMLKLRSVVEEQETLIQTKASLIEKLKL